MSETGRKWLTSLLVAAFGLVVFVPALDWGLPTREADRVLFGDRKPWSGKEILQFIEDGRERSEAQSPTLAPEPSIDSLGADVDVNPILDRSKPFILNDTDAKRAEIVQRYRLMSKQPDEFIQFKALAEMSQRQGLAKLDPRLYQYGGLWIYPVGAFVRTGMLVGYIETPPPGVPAREFYLDHPEVFGKFYIVARAYSTFWGVVGALAIAWITRRLTNLSALAFLAAAAFILLPVTRTAAHEAKPHLAGAALCLCAVIAGTLYAERGKRRHAILAGALSGASMAMVVSMVLSLSVLPVMAWLRWRQSSDEEPNSSPLAGEAGWGGVSGQSVAGEQSNAPAPSPNPSHRGRGVVAALSFASVAAIFVYAFTNPFFIFNALFHPEILRSNLGNSTAMYGIGNLGSAFASALRIAIEGMTLGGVILVGISLLMLVISRWVTRSWTHRRVSAESLSGLPDRGNLNGAVGWILAAPAVCVLIQFILLAAGKPAEYARFGLVAVAALTVLCAVTLRGGLRQSSVTSVFVGLVILAAAEEMTTYAVKNGAQLSLVRGGHPRPDGSPWTLGLAYEPAPWSIMPLNLFRDQLLLTKPAADPKTAAYDVYLYPSNLSSQIGLGPGPESVDWARNRTLMRLGSLETERPSATLPAKDTR